MPKSARKVMAGLEKKGFKMRENDHSFFHLWVGGKKTVVYTKVSHGEKEIADNLLGAMARQLALSRKQLLELVDCPLTEAAYVAQLRAAGVISPPPTE